MQKVGNLTASGFDGSYAAPPKIDDELWMLKIKCFHGWYYSYIGIFRSPIFLGYILSFQPFQIPRLHFFPGGTDPQDGAASHPGRWTRSGNLWPAGEGAPNGIFFKDLSQLEKMIINHGTCRKMGIGVENLIQHDYHEIIIDYHCLSWLFINSVSHPPSYNLPSESLEAKQCSWASP